MLKYLLWHDSDVRMTELDPQLIILIQQSLLLHRLSAHVHVSAHNQLKPVINLKLIKLTITIFVHSTKTRDIARTNL